MENTNEKPRDILREFADKYQEFFNFMNQEHDLILTIEEMDEILHEALKLNEILKSE